MTTIDDVLDRIRESSENTKEVGDRFERLMVAFFRTDRTYRSLYPKAWLWDDWPGNEGKVDTGIDIVVENADGSGYTAVQCKCFAPTNTVNKSDIDSFFTASGKAPFTNRIIVSTTPNWSKHALDALEGQEKPIQRIGVEDLDESSVDWSQWDYNRLDALKVRPRKTERPHQTQAVEATIAGFADHDRGKLIMACGTGKTFTAQRIAEELVGADGTVLVLTPSISLLSQTLKEWTSDASIPLAPLAICSDSKAGKRSNTEDISPYDLVLPATTDPDLIVAQYKRTSSEKNMTVFFSTYQSLPVITEAQKHGVPSFDLIIADEAHRTTGVTIAGEDDSNFTRVHDNQHVDGKKRLYMTATPRVFSDSAKGKAAAVDAVLASMDKAEQFGPEFYRLGFHEAVQRDLLTDYKVLILAVDEAAVSRAFQRQLSDENNEIKLDDATRIVGCVNALAKRAAADTSFASDPDPMERAVAFSNTIAQSKKFTKLFAEVAAQWNAKANGVDEFHVDVDHVDGKFNSLQRESLLHWLKSSPAEDTCKVLSNAKCLTEGVDVPALDAILFLEPRNSQVDVIQAVGRVMRKNEGKQFGYVVLPVGIPSDQTPEQALADNKRFQAVWQVLNALRSHDERMNTVINKLDLNEEPPEIIEVIAVTGEDGDATDPADPANPERQRQLELGFPIDELREGIYAKLVLKVGTRHYWEDWAKDVADIAARHHTRITALIDDPNVGVSEAFDHFVAGLHATINDSITRDDAITMLSQHLITKPIFEALFTEFAFTDSNPVSKAMQGMIDLLDEHSLDKETESLEGFYDSVRLRVEGIDNAAGKQKIITELYESFFKKAFPKAAESLGIVYTPIELVDFVLHAADHALRKHFNGTSITDEGVNVLDPFCGTGTFVVRLLQSGIIKPEDLARKYRNELHSNEYLLLAYYIAAINIESAFHDVATSALGNANYQPFDGIVLTDTFQLGEAGDGTGSMDVFPINNERASHQKSLGIRVIVGNPPYSVGQSSQNDNNQNLKYTTLDKSIAETYARFSKAKLKISLFDSYVRAFRWSSDRVLQSEEGGIVAFVTNGGFIDSNTFDGFRKSIASEFHHIYCYNLRGNARGSGELRKRESGNAFGSGSKTTVAITLLVREPGPVPSAGAQIHYRDIGDYLTREQKLQLVADAAREDALDAVDWVRLTPNAEGDWINQRSSQFGELVPLSGQVSGTAQVFKFHTTGIKTNRDSWNNNFSLATVQRNYKRMVDFFNGQVESFHGMKTGDQRSSPQSVREFVDMDPRRFSWDGADFTRIAQGKTYQLDVRFVRTTMYRPFVLERLNFDPNLNNSRYKLPRLFPDPRTENLVICVTDKQATAPFSVFITREIPSCNLMGAGNITNCYPRYTFADKVTRSADSLFDLPAETVEHGITDSIVAEFATRLGHEVSKDDIFFYIYGILHSAEYRMTFASDLKKDVPRIPHADASADFYSFSNAGRALAGLHLDYESVDPWPNLDVKYSDKFDSDSPESYRVEKMTYAKTGRDTDRTTILYNSHITISNIPLEVHDYTVGSKSALDWIVERYQVKTDKDSGIVNDPNDWAAEHDDPTYIFDLVRRIVTVSMRTNEIVANLPSLNL